MRSTTVRVLAGAALVAVTAGTDVSVSSAAGGHPAVAACRVLPITAIATEASSLVGGVYTLRLQCEVGSDRVAFQVWRLTMSGGVIQAGSVGPDGDAVSGFYSAAVTAAAIDLSITATTAGRNVAARLGLVVDAAGGLAGSGSLTSDNVQSYAGFTCGLLDATDPTGTLTPPDTRTSVVSAGPWAVTGASSVTITCVISVGDYVVGPDDVWATQTIPGSVGTLVSPVQFQNPLGADVWLCTFVSWTYDQVGPVIAGGGGAWEGVVDDFDGSNFCNRLGNTVP